MKHGRAGPPRPPPRTQAGHERRATIHDLPSHVLAHRVAAHLSAADAARLMQAAGRVHRGDLGHVMGQRKREMIEKPAEDIVRIMRAAHEKGLIVVDFAEVMARAHRERELVEGYAALDLDHTPMIACGLYGATADIDEVVKGLSLYGK